MEADLDREVEGLQVARLLLAGHHDDTVGEVARRQHEATERVGSVGKADALRDHLRGVSLLDEVSWSLGAVDLETDEDVRLVVA